MITENVFPYVTDGDVELHDDVHLRVDHQHPLQDQALRPLANGKLYLLYIYQCAVLGFTNDDWINKLDK